MWADFRMLVEADEKISLVTNQKIKQAMKDETNRMTIVQLGLLITPTSICCCVDKLFHSFVLLFFQELDNLGSLTIKRHKVDSFGG